MIKFFRHLTASFGYSGGALFILPGCNNSVCIALPTAASKHESEGIWKRKKKSYFHSASLSLSLKRRARSKAAVVMAPGAEMGPYDRVKDTVSQSQPCSCLTPTLKPSLQPGLWSSRKLHILISPVTVAFTADLFSLRLQTSLYVHCSQHFMV